MAKKMYEEANIAAIAKTIRELAHSEETYKTSEMPDAIQEVSNVSWGIGFDEGYWQGYSEGTNDIGNAYGSGFSDGYDQGYGEGITEGRQAEYDEFWDAFYQSRVSGDKNQGALFAGMGWNETTFRPPFDIVIDQGANYCFWRNQCNVDLVEWCKMLGINITIKPLNASYLFAETQFTRLPVIDLSNAQACSSLLARSKYLVTVDKVIFSEKNSSYGTAFTGVYALENIIVEGVVAKDIDFRNCTKLTKASIESIMSHLSPTATFTVTLSKTAVNNAFTTEEWQNIINAKPANVTVSLV